MHAMAIHSMSDIGPGPRINVTPEISAGAIMQVICVLLVAGGWALTHGTTADNASKAVSDLRTEMTEQIAKLEKTITDGQTAVSLQIAGLPDQRVQLEEAKRRIDALDARITGDERSISDMEVKFANMRADQDSLMRSSGMKSSRQ